MVLDLFVNEIHHIDDNNGSVDLTTIPEHHVHPQGHVTAFMLPMEKKLYKVLAEAPEMKEDRGEYEYSGLPPPEDNLIEDERGLIMDRRPTSSTFRKRYRLKPTPTEKHHVYNGAINWDGYVLNKYGQRAPYKLNKPNNDEECSAELACNKLYEKKNITNYQLDNKEILADVVKQKNAAMNLISHEVEKMDKMMQTPDLLYIRKINDTEEGAARLAAARKKARDDAIDRQLALDKPDNGDMTDVNTVIKRVKDLNNLEFKMTKKSELLLHYDDYAIQQRRAREFLDNQNVKKARIILAQQKAALGGALQPSIAVLKQKARDAVENPLETAEKIYLASENPEEAIQKITRVASTEAKKTARRYMEDPNSVIAHLERVTHDVLANSGMNKRQVMAQGKSFLGDVVGM